MSGLVNTISTFCVKISCAVRIFSLKLLKFIKPNFSLIIFLYRISLKTAINNYSKNGLKCLY